MLSLGRGRSGTSTVLEESGVVGVPLGGVPTTEAVLLTVALTTSVCWVLYDPVQVVEAPGARVDKGQLTLVNNGSLTVTAVMVTLPIFLTTKLYGIFWPAAEKFVAVVDFTIESNGD